MKISYYTNTTAIAQYLTYVLKLVTTTFKIQVSMNTFFIVIMSIYQSHTLSYSFLSVPPRLTSYSDNQTVNEGSNLSLFCNATGKPAPNITWTRVSEDEVLFVGNPWHIININRTYRGTYLCIADSGVSNPVNSAIFINVLCEYTLYYHSSLQRFLKLAIFHCSSLSRYSLLNSRLLLATTTKSILIYIHQVF